MRINIHKYQSGRYLETEVAYSYEEAELHIEDLLARGVQVSVTEDSELEEFSDLDYPVLA